MGCGGSTWSTESLKQENFNELTIIEEVPIVEEHSSGQTSAFLTQIGNFPRVTKIFKFYYLSWCTIRIVINVDRGMSILMEKETNRISRNTIKSLGEDAKFK
ncbi:hypothetical protein PR048_013171 [Dryococelus australis]|uniref:Uncharacterized protein n=1 Tax=Dryococelus australis TaxID=614101 RepID=A0ABQ9HRW0_9NEOP|nr:hypothetical protein PR048_013171 [Dryococelus australis]